MLRLKEKYKKEVIPKMKEEFGYKNDMAVPRVNKAVVNTGFGRLVVGETAENQKKIYTAILDDLSQITGQRPVLTRAKKSISAFKVRQGSPIGAKVTLRGKMMYDFLERVINIALPRSRDFRGISPDSIDPRGNLTLALKEHIAFPEILPEKAKTIFGFEITVVTTAKTKKEGVELFRLLGFPIKS